MLSDYCDAVVMLLGPGGPAELRRGTYHYAKRFADHLPVLLVQPDLERCAHELEPSELPNVTVLHVGKHGAGDRAAALRRALAEREIHHPLLWIYNFRFSDFIASTYAPIKVYHATEDYFCEDWRRLLGVGETAVDPLRRVLDGCDLLVSVSEGVREDYLREGGFRGASLVVGHGCDFDHWAGCAASADRDRYEKIAIYQGSINEKIDLPMLLQAAVELPDWVFWLCGPVALQRGDGLGQWNQLCRLDNVEYLGPLSGDDLKKRMSCATVGLIPFVREDWVSERSSPLSAWEYLACGLPVVTVPIRSLEPHSSLLVPVRTPQEMAPAILRAEAECGIREKVEARLAAAQAEDYGRKVRQIAEKIEECIPFCETSVARRNVIVLYDENFIHINTLKEHLDSFGTYSCHNVHYAPVTGKAQCALDLSVFDAVVVHYSVRVCMPGHHMSSSYIQALREFNGLKIQMLQDEYETTSIAWKWIEEMGVHVVYTVVPRAYIPAVYPPQRFPRTEFIANLTGYVPIRMEHRSETKPMARRRYVLGYRGRALPYWYGKLGQEKLMIGVNMKRICRGRGIPCNIEWDEEHRLYGRAWYDFTEDCRAVLGTESGANVFDFDGTLRRNITEALEAKADLTFEEAFERFLRDHEGRIVMNQVSPRIFEAIALRTALVLFEGTYSGVVEPDQHYIPLKKDYSNVDDVLRRLQDVDDLEALTERAYRDVIAPGTYSYRTFIRGFDDMLARKLRRAPGRLLISMPVSAPAPDGESAASRRIEPRPQGTLPTDVVLPMPLEQFQEDLRPPVRAERREAAGGIPDRTGGLARHCDAVIMLTWSDWRTEMRSNRYHYARRFAEHLPVLFVQPDLEHRLYAFEPTELPNVTILHVPRDYTSQQAEQIRLALAQREIHNPLLWIYNFMFGELILSTWAPIKVYHATEDYFSRASADGFSLERFLDVFAGCDLLVSVSEGLEDYYLQTGRFHGASLVVGNGCDFDQWAGCATSTDRGKHGKTALYQGTIGRKIDFGMLLQAAREMPDWSFWFCGRVETDPGDWRDKWQTLCSLDNVEYLGKLPPDKLRDCMSRATVGLIPFVQTDWIVYQSLPMKAFEYLACGLPVVTVGLRALRPQADLFVHVRTPAELAPAIKRAALEYTTPQRIEAGLAAAKAQDYDRKFPQVVEAIRECLTTVETAAVRRNVLVLYDQKPTYANTLKEHLESFGTYSCHNVHYAPATGQARCVLDLSLFDVVVVHYSIRVNLPEHPISESYAKAVREFKGLKVLFIQDEHEATATAWKWINETGIHVVYTCVPRDGFAVAYPPGMFPRTEIVETLTGFVPIEMERLTRAKPMARRRYVLGYRSRKRPYWYGTRGHEKRLIGVNMKRICQERGISCSIEWDDEHRLYGPAWYDFLEDCRAVLGTETGAEVFDVDGTLARAVTTALEENPGMTFEEAFERFLRGHEGTVAMNPVSPKIFEAIAMRTALVLFEGGYGGVVRGEEHFIPLKKDYGNVDDVLAKLQDLNYLDKLTARAHQDVIGSGRYSYRTFIRDFDDMLARKWRRGSGRALVSTIVSARAGGGEITTFHEGQPPDALPTNVVLPAPPEEPEAPPRMPDPREGLTGIRRFWAALPGPVRWPIRLLLKPPARFARAIKISMSRTEPHRVTPLQGAILRCKLRMTKDLIVLKQLSRIEPDSVAEPGAINEKGPFLKISAREGEVRMTAVASLGGPGRRIRCDLPPAESDLHAVHPPQGLRLTQWANLGRQSWRYELDGGVCVLWDELPVGHAELQTDLLSILLPDCFQIRPLASGFVFTSKGYTLRGDVKLSRDVSLSADVTRLVGWRCVPARLRRDPNRYTLSVPPTGLTGGLETVTVLQAGSQEPPEATIELLWDGGASWGAKLDVNGRRYLLLGPDLPQRREYPGCERVRPVGRPVAVRYEGDEMEVIWAITDEGLVRFG